MMLLVSSDCSNDVWYSSQFIDSSMIIWLQFFINKEKNNKLFEFSKPNNGYKFFIGYDVVLK